MRTNYITLAKELYKFFEIRRRENPLIKSPEIISEEDLKQIAFIFARGEGMTAINNDLNDLLESLGTPKDNSDLCKNCGRCCRIFYLPGTKEDLLTKTLRDRTKEWIEKDIIELTRDEIIQTGPIFTEDISNDSHYYTCRLHDPEKGICTDYENRPIVCRVFPSSLMNGGGPRYDCKLAMALFGKNENDQPKNKDITK